MDTLQTESNSQCNSLEEYTGKNVEVFFLKR